MNRNLIMPSLVCGFGAGVLTTVPGIKNVGCCLVVPFAAILSLYLDIRLNHSDIPINFKKAIAFGILTGLFAAIFSTFFDVLITYIAHTNDFVDTLPQTESLIKSYKLGALLDQTMGILQQMANNIKTYGFSPFYTFGIFVSNSFIDSIFGLLGGLIGMSFINRKAKF
jgi:Protein of unknown function (DUF4199)